MPPRVINEDEALPDQPSAKTRFTMDGLGLTIQGDIGGLQLAMEQHVDATADDEYINERLDMMTRAFWRQQAQIRLVEALVDVRARRESLASLPEREREYVKARAAERDRTVASFVMRHNASPRRAEYSPTTQDKATLESYDATTAAKRAEFESDRVKLEKEIPLYEAQVARQRAIVNGASRVDALEEALPLAAE